MKGPRYRVDLSDTEYYIFTLSEIGLYKQNVLAPLKLTSLDISRTPFVDPSELAGLQLKELKMTGMEIVRRGLLQSNLQHLGVKKLIVDKGTFAPIFAKQLKSQLELVELEPVKQ